MLEVLHIQLPTKTSSSSVPVNCAEMPFCRLTSLCVHKLQHSQHSQEGSCAGGTMLMQHDSLVARSEVERIHRLQDDTFMRGCIPWWIAGVGYVVFAALAIIVIPFLYTPVKW